MLRECLRVLKRGGLIRLVIPDLELIARNYIKDNEGIRNNKRKRDYLPSERFLDMLDLVGAERTKMPSIPKILSSKHKCMYDYFSLTGLLASCGFVDIEKRAYKEGECPDIDFLDNRPEHSLYLEARKP